MRRVDIRTHRDYYRIHAELLAPEGFVIEEQFDFGRVCVHHDRNLVALLAGPVPVWKDMDRRDIGPLALVHVITVFRETGEIDDTEVRAARRPLGAVAVRCGLAEIIEARPDKLTHDIR